VASTAERAAAGRSRTSGLAAAAPVRGQTQIAIATHSRPIAAAMNGQRRRARAAAATDAVGPVFAALRRAPRAPRARGRTAAPVSRRSGSIASSACSIAAASGQRSSRAFASARCTIASTPTGIASCGATSRSVGGGCSVLHIMVS